MASSWAPCRCQRRPHGAAPLGIDLPHVVTTSRGQRPDRGFGIRDHGHPRRREAADLGRVAVDLEQRRPPRDAPVVQPGRVEPEANPECERHVRPREAGRPFELVQRAAVPLVVVGDRADLAVVGKARNPCDLEQLVDRYARRVARGHRPAGSQDAGRGRQPVEARVDDIGTGCHRRRYGRALGRQLRRRVEHISRDVEEHRPAGCSRRNPDRLRHDAPELVDRVDLARPLAHRRREGQMVDADLQAVGLERRLRSRADRIDDRVADRASAFVIDVRTFVSPGPGQTAATPSVPVSRENASAAKPALPSWRTSTSATSRSAHAWKIGSICTPWMAKIAVVAGSPHRIDEHMAT